MHVEVRAMRLCVSELEKDIRQTRGDMADAVIRAASDLADAVPPALLHLAAEYARVQEAEGEARTEHGERSLAQAAVLAENTLPGVLYAAHAYASQLDLVHLARQRAQEGGLAPELLRQLEESGMRLEDLLPRELAGTVPDPVEQSRRLADDVDIETLWLAYRRSCHALAERIALEQYGEVGYKEAEALAGTTPLEALELAHLKAQLRKAEEEHPPEASE